MATNQAELRLQSKADELGQNNKLHEHLLASIGEANTPSESQAEQIVMYRENSIALMAEIQDLTEDVERNRRADEASKAIRRALASNINGVDVDGDEVVYREFTQYVHDMMITRNSPEFTRIAKQWGRTDEDIASARERLQLLKRTPANTLSTDVPGLIPDQHIAQIFQVIDSSRPIVASSPRANLERGTLTYPRLDAGPIVAVQSAEKTEAGNTGLDVSMQTATASTYLGGGDLSWQAIQWSTPNAIELWFRVVAADYALKTEQDAAQVLQHSAFSNNIASTLAATPTFAQFMTAVGAGGGEVFANSGRLADTIYMAPDRYWYIFGTTSDAFAQFTQVSLQGVGPLSVVVSRGMDSGVIVVGDRQGLLVAETAGAPVELRVVEPAIGGVEVGLIGAFEAVVVDDGSFAMITAAS